MFIDNEIQVATSDEHLYSGTFVNAGLKLNKDKETAAIIGGGDGGVARECISKGFGYIVASTQLVLASVPVYQTPPIIFIIEDEVGLMGVKHVSKGLDEEWKVGKTEAEIATVEACQKACREWMGTVTPESEDNDITENPESRDQVI